MFKIMLIYRNVKTMKKGVYLFLTCNFFRIILKDVVVSKAKTTFFLNAYNYFILMSSTNAFLKIFMIESFIFIYYRER